MTARFLEIELKLRHYARGGNDSFRIANRPVEKLIPHYSRDDDVASQIDLKLIHDRVGARRFRCVIRLRERWPFPLARQRSACRETGRFR
jgi:hypothetical protein